VDHRDVLIDGIVQMNEWMDAALDGLTNEQVNYLPEGKTTSIGFNAWHVFRTQDNIVNFVFRKQPPIWMEQGYLDKMGLPKVEQGTGMDTEIARSIKIGDLSVLREYGKKAGEACASYLKNVDLDSLNEVQMIKPLGEMPRWRVFRQVCMTHGFMHLGEVNAVKGQLGLGFFI
jgi:DinB superfamily